MRTDTHLETNAKKCIKNQVRTSTHLKKQLKYQVRTGTHLETNAKKCINNQVRTGTHLKKQLK